VSRRASLGAVGFSIALFLASSSLGARGATGTILSAVASSSSAAIGAEIQVAIRVNTDVQVNAVAANLTYPAVSLEFLGVQVDPAWGVQALATGGGGNIQVHVGATSALTGERPVATVRFRGLRDATAVVSFAADSEVTRADGSGASVLNSSQGAKIVIGTGGSSSAKQPNSRVSIAREGSQTNWTVGEEAKATVTVSNAAQAGLANNAHLVLSGAGLEIVGTQAPLGRSCVGSSSKDCSLGDLAPGSVVTIPVTVRFTTAGSARLEARVDQAEPDAGPADNSASFTFSVNSKEGGGPPPSTPTSPPARKSSAFFAALVKVEKLGSRSNRSLTLTLVVNRPGQARIELFKSGKPKTRKPVLAKTIGLGSGRSHPSVRIPRSTPTGWYRLSVRILPTSGTARTLSRPLKLA
jgi:hypothetical protein